MKLVMLVVIILVAQVQQILSSWVEVTAKGNARSGITKQTSTNPGRAKLVSKSTLPGPETNPKRNARASQPAASSKQRKRSGSDVHSQPVEQVAQYIANDNKYVSALRAGLTTSTTTTSTSTTSTTTSPTTTASPYMSRKDYVNALLGKARTTAGPSESVVVESEAASEADHELIANTLKQIDEPGDEVELPVASDDHDPNVTTNEGMVEEIRDGMDGLELHPADEEMGDCHDGEGYEPVPPGMIRFGCFPPVPLYSGEFAPNISVGGLEYITEESDMGDDASEPIIPHRPVLRIDTTLSADDADACTTCETMSTGTAKLHFDPHSCDHTPIDETTSEENSTCMDKLSDADSGPVPEVPASVGVQSLEDFLEMLVKEGPTWPRRELTDERWESTFKAHHQLRDQRRNIDAINGSRYSISLPTPAPGAYVATSEGTLLLVREVTWDRVRPFNPSVGTRQYFLAALVVNPHQPQTSVIAGKYYTVKTADLNSDGLLDHEIAVLKTIEAANIAPKPLFISGTSNSLMMEARFSAVEVPRGPTLFEFMLRRPHMDALEVLAVVREVLWLIAELHSYGIAHGGISGNTVVFDGPRLILTEFEFSVFYTRRIRPLYFDEFRWAAPAMESSPFELRRQPVSRRDDLYRWIELAARLLLREQFDRVMAHTSQDRLDKLLLFKTREPFFNLNGTKMWEPWRGLGNPAGVKRIKSALGGILNYIRELGIDDNPDYEGIDDILVQIIDIVRASNPTGPAAASALATVLEERECDDCA